MHVEKECYAKKVVWNGDNCLYGLSG